MLDYLLTTSNGWLILKSIAILVPVLMFLWIVVTVMALHKRGVHFWSLGSTWTTIFGCPAGLIIASFSTWSDLKDPNAPPFEGLIVAGFGLYAVAFAYSIFYNYKATKSALLAISTSMLQQLAVLGAIFLFLRWRGDEVNRGR